MSKSYDTLTENISAIDIADSKSKKLLREACDSALNWLLIWSIPLLLLGVWFYLTATNNLNQLFPTPKQLLDTTVRFILDGTLAENMKISLFRALSGFVIGGGIGFLLGLATGLFRIADKVLNTPVQMVRSVPRLAVLPLILVWFGIGETSKIVLIALSTFFPIYLNTYHGIRSIDNDLLEMGKVYGFSSWELFKNVILPGATSSIMIGVRQSLGGMWLILIVAETIAAKSGIGYMATNAREYMMMDVIVLSMILFRIVSV